MSYFSAIIITAVESYLLGSISFGLIFTRLFDKIDIRTVGSGNTGMTNVLRCAGIWPGILTGICDFFKGFIGISVGRLLADAAGMDRTVCVYVAATAALLGHIFPLYFGFHGGKGVMTTAGISLQINPLLLVAELAVFFAVVFKTRIVSLASVIAACCMPVAALLISVIQGNSPWMPLAYSLFTALVILWTHRTNISRLKNGTESKFEMKK